MGRQSGQCAELPGFCCDMRNYYLKDNREYGNLCLTTQEGSGELRKKLFLLIAYIALGVSVSAANIGFAAPAAERAQTEESRTIPFPAGYNITSSGASAYRGAGDVKNSPYYTSPDYYNLKSTATLTILPRYKTYQQTTEVTCGPAAALTVLQHFGNTDWEEYKIASIMETKPEIGTDTSGMVKFFKTIGWEVQSSLTAAGKDGASFKSVHEFKGFIIANLKLNTPVMVENIDWGGHWRVIIGYDDMGTETTADDVIILADSYDTADHLQDGYVATPVEKFYYMWFDAHMLPKDQKKQQWLIAKPPQS